MISSEHEAAKADLATKIAAAEAAQATVRSDLDSVNAKLSEGKSKRSFRVNRRSTHSGRNWKPKKLSRLISHRDLTFGLRHASNDSRLYSTLRLRHQT